MGSTLVWALLLIVLALVAGIGLARYGDRVPWLADLMGKPTQTTETVVLGVHRLNELATAEMVTQVVVTEEENTRILTKPLPEFLTGEKVLLVAVGKVEAGIDLDELGALPRTDEGVGRRAGLEAAGPSHRRGVGRREGVEKRLPKVDGRYGPKK